MKKILVGLLIMSILTISVIALTLSNEQPSDGSTVSGDVSSVTFSVDTDDATALGGTIYIKGQPSTALVCVGNPKICSINKNLSGWAEQNYSYYFFITDGSNPYYYPAGAPAINFTLVLDETPDAPSNVAMEILGNTSLFISWDNLELDILNYVVYSNRTGTWTNESNSTELNYTSNGLTQGLTYCYNITAIDLINQESQSSARICGVPMDITPPEILSINPPNESVVTITPNVSFNYSEPVWNVSIYIGNNVFPSIITNISMFDYEWNPTLLNDALYIFHIKAFDYDGNEGDYEYILSTTNGSIEIIIGDNPPVNGTKTENYPANYNSSFITELRMDWTDDVGIINAIINLDGVEYVLGGGNVIKEAGDTYLASFLGLRAGAHNYTWNATDTAGQKSSSGPWLFTINQADPNLQINFIPGSVVNEYTQTTSTCISDAINTIPLDLYRGSILTTNPDIKTLLAGLWVYNCTTTGDENYTSSYLEQTLTVLDDGPEAFFRAGLHPRSTAPPGQYIVLNYTWEMPGGNGSKAKMTDLISGLNDIQIDEESQPVLLCGEYYSGNFSQDPTTYLTESETYLVDNNYNVTDDAVYCHSNRQDDEIGIYEFLLMIPIPVSTVAGNYNSVINFQPWSG